MKRLGSQRLYHGVASLALLGGLMGTTTAPGGTGGLLGGLLGGGGDANASPQSTTISGHLAISNQRLRKGCRAYAYRYRLQVPNGIDYDFEVFVTDPRGISQASDVILSGADPLSGTKHFTICRSNTVPGRFVLHGTLYTNDGQGPTTTTKVADAPFRLTVPGHKKRHHRA